jgi:predicted PhzF superfamily epimerase YddE/YHI9
VLWETGRQAGPARFHTRSGPLTARRVGDDIELDFPATPPAPVEPPPGLLEALCVESSRVLKTRFDYLVVLDDEAAVRAANPDMRALRELEVRGIMVTAKGDGQHDFVSRFFAPGAGVDEDPVTGSAHCALAPFWAGELGRASLSAYQASPRGGRVGVEVAGDRVKLRGRAVTVLEGELRAAANPA